MHMLYNSDNYVVVQFEFPAGTAGGEGGVTASAGSIRRGGFEIVDKFARKEIFIEGAMAERFREGVAALMQTRGSEDDMDDYIGRYSSLMQQPLVQH